MGYYLRVFAFSEAPVPVPEIQERLKEEGLAATIEVDAGKERCWEQIALTHQDNGGAIAGVERDAIVPGSLGDQELVEFVSALDGTKPSSAARYLRGNLQRVKVIYAFQILRGVDRDDGWEIVYAVQELLIEKLGGILQADLEGFSNEDGYHITWEFSASATGEWTMAVLDPNGHWIAFCMDLGNKEHREALCEGRIPPGLQTWDAGHARIL